MNGLFSEKRMWMIGTIIGPNGSAHSEVLGVTVEITMGDKSWRASKIGGSSMEASRDALHVALQKYFQNLKKVEVAQGNESEVWAAIVNDYHRQLSSGQE